MERLSMELDYVVGDLWALTQQALNSEHARVLIKKEVESFIDQKILKKMFKQDIIKVAYTNERTGMRACVVFTDKGTEYCKQFFPVSQIVF